MPKDVAFLAVAFLFGSSLVLVPWPKHGRTELFLRIGMPAIFALLVFGIGYWLPALSGALGHLSHPVQVVEHWRDIILMALPAWLVWLEPLIFSAFALLADAAAFLAGVTGVGIKALMLLTIALLVSYGLFRVVLLSLLLILSWLRRTVAWIYEKLLVLLGRKPAAKEGEGSAFNLPPRKHFLIPALTVTLIILGLTLSVMPWWADMNIAAQYFSILLWVGSWVFVLEMWSLLRSSKVLAGGELDISSDGANAEGRLALEKLFEAYRRQFGDLLYRSYPQEAKPHSPPAFTEGGENVELARRLFNDVFPNQLTQKMLPALQDFLLGHDLLFAETLSQAHLLLYSEMIKNTLNYEGRVLIVCPDGSVGDLEVALDQVFTEYYSKIAHKVYTETQTREFENDADLFIYTVSGLERLLQRTLPEELALVIVLGVHALDLSLLRHELARLWLRVDQGAVRKVFQIDRLFGAEPTVRAITEQHDLRERRINPELYSHRYVLLWRGDAAAEGLKKEYLPNYQGYVAAIPLLTYLPSSNEFKLLPVWADLDHRVDIDLLERLAYLDCPVRCDIVHSLYRMPVNSSVVVKHDRHNLVYALTQNHLAWQTSYLINIVCGDYLLREMMIRLPKDAPVPEKFLPVLPHVTGNISDLAHQVMRALNTNDGLASDELQCLLERFPVPSMLAKYQISPTLRGLKQLLNVALGLSNVYVNCHQRGGVFYYRSTGGIIADNATLRVVDDGGSELSCWKTADYGLLYHKNITMLIGGKHYFVSDVDFQLGQVRVKHIDDESKRPVRYVGDCEYRFHSESLISTHQPVRVSRKGLDVEPSLVSVDFTRSTFGVLELGEFESTPDKAKYLYCQPVIECSRRWCNALKLSFFGDAVNGLDIARTSFTLAALLRDVLFSVFPYQETRLAVLPGRRPPFVRYEQSQYTQEGMPFYLYPSLENEIADAVDVRRINVFILEDSDGDLGVAKTIAFTFERYLELIYEYLSIAEQEGNEGDLPSYHRFGGEKLPESLDYGAVKAMLDPMFSHKEFMGFQEENDNVMVGIDSTVSSGECDFCGVALGAEYSVLNDGRQRCPSCSKDAVEGENLRQIEEEVVGIIESMEARYKINLPRNIEVKITSADTISRYLGSVFVPSQGFDPRAVGLAIMNDGGLTILIENGAPRADFRMTVAHELTHVWQYTNVSSEKLRNVELVEGQATYVMIDFGFSHGLEKGAENQLAQVESRQDEYGRGLRLVRDKCEESLPSDLFDCFLKLLENADPKLG